MANDSKNLSRTGQRLIVEYRKAFGNPPTYPPTWQPLWDVKVDRIEINQGAKPSVATIWFPNTRWNDNPPISLGDTIRIRTDQQNPENRTIIFVGYAVNRPVEFSGGSASPGAGFERNAFVCMDHRWVIGACSIIFGQISRSPDDYMYYSPTEPIPDRYTYLTGQRLIFNPNGKSNMDPQELASDAGFPDMPIFCNPGNSTALSWTARDMIRYILSPRWRKVNDYLPIDDPAAITGLEVMADGYEDKKNWGKVLKHIAIEGVNTIEGTEVVCRHIGWDFRLDYNNDGSTEFAFFKVGVRDKFERSDSPVISHFLHAPAVGEDISAAVAEGRKMLWSMSLSQDIAPVINNPFALGAPHRFEFTTELVPAWLDYYLAFDTQDLSKLFYTDAELQKITNPDSLTYYNFYHSRGQLYNQSANARNVGRKWTLNEAGTYTDPFTVPDDGKQHYDRGQPFDWATVLPADYILDKATGRRMFARYNRRLLPCLTVLQDGLSSVGIKLEFSFDGGVTWQVIPCSVRLLDNECGIYIDEPNISEIVDKAEGTIASGTLQGIQLNLFTSLADDRINTNDFLTGLPLGHTRRFKDGQWRTRCRITASVQMDLRVIAMGSPSPSSGSPFDQSQIYDWSDKYGLSKRADSSSYKSGFLNAREVDSRNEATAHVDAIRRNNEDMSISGRFTLDRLWLGDGAGIPAFMVGDAVSGITGREYMLDTLTFEGGKTSPEIIQIIYLPESQKQVLITRDLRYAANKIDV